MGRYDELVENQRRTVLEGQGETETALRRAVAARAAELSGAPAAPAGAEIPAGLKPFVDAIALHAYRITDADVAALGEAGWSEDAIFEVSISAAVGAGLARLERGLAVLRGGAR
ncbi:MAG TPA: hypothetical protein VF173_11465 [Thermoanaerobaculia bacterium]|nr:hypothetical protein [Thermoanaerobaculia bacterium]